MITNSTSVLLNASDSRGPKAVAIATDAGQWLKCRTRDGQKAYGIRSSRDRNHVYFVTRTSCSCYDARRRVCKHQLAVQLHCALVAEQRIQPVETRTGLVPVRIADDEIVFERRTKQRQVAA